METVKKVKKVPQGFWQMTFYLPISTNNFLFPVRDPASNLLFVISFASYLTFSEKKKGERNAHFDFPLNYQKKYSTLTHNDL